MICRGQIYFASLDPSRGREQSGKRPLLVVSSDSINRLPLVVTVVPGTDAKNVNRDYPTNVRVTARESGLPKDTVFLCFQVRSLDPARFMDPVTRKRALAGTISTSRMEEVDRALRIVLAL